MSITRLGVSYQLLQWCTPGRGIPRSISVAYVAAEPGLVKGFHKCAHANACFWITVAGVRDLELREVCDSLVDDNVREQKVCVRVWWRAFYLIKNANTCLFFLGSCGASLCKESVKVSLCVCAVNVKARLDQRDGHFSVALYLFFCFSFKEACFSFQKEIDFPCLCAYGSHWERIQQPPYVMRTRTTDAFPPTSNDTFE